MIHGLNGLVRLVVRAEIESFDSIETIEDDMRGLIEDKWPDLVIKLPPKTPD